MTINALGDIRSLNRGRFSPVGGSGSGGHRVASRMSRGPECGQDGTNMMEHRQRLGLGPDVESWRLDPGPRKLCSREK